MPLGQSHERLGQSDMRFGRAVEPLRAVQFLESGQNDAAAERRRRIGAQLGSAIRGLERFPLDHDVRSQVRLGEKTAAGCHRQLERLGDLGCGKAAHLAGCDSVEQAGQRIVSHSVTGSEQHTVRSEDRPSLG